MCIMSNPARELAHSAGITHYTVLTFQREKSGLWRPGFGLGAFFVAI